MSFAIRFTDDADEYPYDDPGVAAAVGRVVLGENEECFISTLKEWSRQDYEAQWKRAIELFIDGADRAMLVTEYLSPNNASHLVGWVLYKGVDDIVYMQNQLLFYDQLDKPFSVKMVEKFIKSRTVSDEDGNAVSEWRIKFTDIESFYKKF